MANQKKKQAPPDLTKLKPFSRNGGQKEEKSNLMVVIETPRGSRNKYAFNPELGVFELRKVLPEGMVFPYDFGFVPSTLADDGDPFDVLVLMDQSAFPGCIVTSRLIGVVEGEETKDGKTERDDRLIAVACQSHTHSDIQHIKDLNETMLEELEKFFETYHFDDSTKFKVLGYRGPKQALRLLKSSISGKSNGKK